MKFSGQQIQQVLNNKGYRFFDGDQPYNANIIGIRSNNDIANSFDDWLYLIYRNESLAQQIFEFPVTTDPGKYWLENPLNVNGTAVLVPGQYRGAYEIGLHQGKYEALRQKGKVKVWRDNTGDDRIDKGGQVYEGVFGINIHRSNAQNESYIVEKWSAGCTVFKRVKDFNFFMEICRRASKIYGNSFTYTLLEERDFQVYS
ncbi:hypothetical protein GWK08_09720 [Leptobacterium flavescens]|uniref:Uncharacterized protein n=1 Tax=Leptobacterium flavescens TaxID=472055 RepID=A0A6P0UTH2_9FLAO|nr:hypothetical protein [Leptobacterium flavescens]NER13716.1 hypothetical protein [Leptobacterium flavescens]